MTDAAKHVRELLAAHPAPWRLEADDSIQQIDIRDARGRGVLSFEDTPDERTFHLGIVAAVNLLAELIASTKQRQKLGSSRR